MSIDAPDPAAQHPLLVTTQWLADHLDDPNLVLVDAGEAVAYRRAHIASAHGVPHPYLKAGDGVFVMPAADFEELARSFGVSNDSQVVVYDDNASLHAARVWWVFQHYGFDRVRVVDGGLNAWLDEGRPLTSAPPPRRRGDVVAADRPKVLCTLDQLRSGVGSDLQIWDARSDGEWSGENDRGNKRVGHVPGARHLEWVRLMQGPPARRFRPLGEIRSALTAAGLDPEQATVTYCQGGIRAAFAAFVLRMLGNASTRTYDGSMEEWANREDTPLALGI